MRFSLVLCALQTNRFRLKGIVLNTKVDILKNVGNQTVDVTH